MTDTGSADAILDSAVILLTRPHPARIPGEKKLRLAEEDALLDQLEVLKAGHKTGGGSSTQQRAPLSLDAVIIEQDIIHTIHHTVPVHRRHELACMGIKPRVERWAQLVDESLVRVHADDWAGRIRALLESYRDLRHVACPHCGVSQVEVDEGDEVIRMAALVARMSSPMVVTCRNWECGSVWVGTDELLSLGAIARKMVE